MFTFCLSLFKITAKTIVQTAPTHSLQPSWLNSQRKIKDGGRFFCEDKLIGKYMMLINIETLKFWEVTKNLVTRHCKIYTNMSKFNKDFLYG